MSPAILSALGGLGLFLFGMRVMTEALRSLAGDRLHRWLARVTRTPLSGAATGALTTAVIQSSSATTVTAVGFVGAGLLTFEQSLGVIFGANIGTTITGWIVAVLGFKVKLGTLSLPVIFAAALLMLIGRGRGRDAGKALAGFSLLFLGLEYLKDGLEGSASGISFESFSSATLLGRLVLVGVGLVLTILMQSSSATVATTLAALSTGILDLPQALAVVIGADVGTTATAWLATIGGSTASRRTGRAHVVYNLITGAAAFLILPVYHWAVTSLVPDAATTNAALATVGFHSAFNCLGVLVILPFTNQFANLMRRLVPERSDSPSAVLDPKLAQTPMVAIEALHAATAETARRTVGRFAACLETFDTFLSEEEIEFLRTSNSDCRNFVGPLSTTRKPLQDRITALLHACDHIERLLDRCRDHSRIKHLAAVPSLAEQARELQQEARSLALWLNDPATHPSPEGTLTSLATRLESDRDQLRHQFVEAAAGGLRSPSDLDQDLDSHRWLRRCAWHLARISQHVRESLTADLTPVQSETAR